MSPDNRAAAVRREAGAAEEVPLARGPRGLQHVDKVVLVHVPTVAVEVQDTVLEADDAVEVAEVGIVQVNRGAGYNVNVLLDPAAVAVLADGVRPGGALHLDGQAGQAALEEVLLCLLHDLGLTARPGAGQAGQPLRQVAAALLGVLQGLLVSGGVTVSDQITTMCHHSDDGVDKCILTKGVDKGVEKGVGKGVDKGVSGDQDVDKGVDRNVDKNVEGVDKGVDEKRNREC